MTKHLISRALGLSLALTALAGCGSTSLLSAATTGTDAASLQAAANGKGGHGPRGDMQKGGNPANYFADLDLTDDQKTQIEAIQAKYRPAKPTADASARPEAPGAKLQAILVAETLDVDALKAALAEKPAAPKADQADNRVAELAEIRAVLTEEQRAAIVEKLNAAPTPTDRPSLPANLQKPDASAIADQLATKLGLNDAQKAAFVALQAKLEANRPAAPTAEPDFAAHRAAEIAFWQTGDTTGLGADKPAAVEPPAFPVDELVAFASSLSAEQRAQVFAKGGFALGMGRGGHEGPGGKGGDRGHGGKGGPGGFGGQPPQAPADQASAE